MKSVNLIRKIELGSAEGALICEYPRCGSIGTLMLAELWPSGDTIEYVRCSVHGMLESVVIKR